MRNIFGREPAVFWAMAATLANALFLLAPWSDEVHGAVNAFVLILAGFLTASWVSLEKALPLLAGLIKGIFAIVLAFGLDVSAPTQVAILAIAAAVSAFFIRTQVVAPVRAQVAAA